MKDKFKNNIFFVTVSKKPNLNLIVQELYQRKGSQVPDLQTEVIAFNWLQEFLKQTNPLLLVLDDVWSESESLLEKFDELKMSNNKILVTSRFAFPRFGSPYYLESLNEEDAMALFNHSASLGNRSSYIPEDLSRKVIFLVIAKNVLINVTRGNRFVHFLCCIHAHVERISEHFIYCVNLLISMNANFHSCSFMS